MPFVPGSLSLRTARAVLRGGGIIACPTEAVWGLSCDPDNAGAVQRLLTLKDRPLHKGLILVAASMSQLGYLLADLPGEQRDTLSATWPGPATWLVPHQGRVQPWVHGEHNTVAVRVTDHPVMRALCLAWGGPLVSTSANPSGSRAPTAAFQVHRYFGRQLDYVVPGAVGEARRPSVIRDLATGNLIRA